MPADQAATWMQQAQAVGWLVTEGTSTENIPQPGQANPQTLWNLTAQAIEGQSAETAAEWLIQADSLGWLIIPFNVPTDPSPDPPPDDSGGDDDSSEPPAQPTPPEEVYTAINIYPNEPLTLDINNVNSGRLAPYGEHWYELTRNDFDKDLIEDMALSMFATPSQGFMSNRVNFELFPAGLNNQHPVFNNRVLPASFGVVLEFPVPNEALLVIPAGTGRETGLIEFIRPQHHCNEFTDRSHVTGIQLQ